MVDSLTSFSGLATGLDTTSIVSELVRVESLPIQRLRVRQANHDSMASRFGTIRTRLDSLKEAMAAITDSDAPSVVSSGDESAVRATAAGEATSGTYRVEVSSLAAAHRSVSSGVSTRDEAGNFSTGSSIDITVGTDDVVSIDLLDADTLDSVAQRINDSDARVTADVIFDGTDYRLQITGDDTGAANGVSFTENGTSLGLSDVANQVVSASDAAFTVDGLAMTRPSNDVSEAIPGVRLDLESVTSEPVTISVGADANSVTERMQAFVDAYNSVSNGINVESVFAGEARTGDSLSGDSTLRALQRDLSSALLTAFPGFETIREIGLETTQTGMLEFDEEAFSSVLNSDPAGLETALAGDGTTPGLFENLTSLVDRYTNTDDGLITARIEGFAEQNRSIDDRIASMELRVEKFEETLLRRFASLETLVGGLNSQGSQLLAVLGNL